jgi:hypothetical protein
MVPPGYSSDSTASLIALATPSEVMATDVFTPKRSPDPGVPVVHMGVVTILLQKVLLL